MNKIQSRTDLALELQEDLGNDSYVEGIKVKTRVDHELGFKETKILVETKEAAKQIGKPIGTYITLESGQLLEEDEKYHEEMSQALYDVVNELMEDADKILVVGLGNMQVTPDALGPLVIDNLFVTRHLKKGNIIEGTKELSAITPGVMAQTGMESSEIIKGIVDRIKPDVIIAIDALAARNSSRLNKTIQICDTGISPGSGVGNHRKAIDQETMGVKVIAIGVPTVISVPTIVNDSMEAMLRALGKGESAEAVSGFTEKERYDLACEILEPDLSTMFVTPKNIDEAVKRISFTISEAINQYNAKNFFIHNQS